MRLVTTMCLCFLTASLLSQITKKELNSDPKKVEVSIIGGFNNTTMHIDGYELKAGMREFFGFQVDRNFNQRLSLSVSFARTNRLSHFNNASFNKKGIEVNFFPQITLGDFAFRGGVQFVNSILEIDDLQSFSSIETPNNQEGIQLNPVLGFDVKLDHQLYLLFNSTLNVDKTADNNWQVGIRYNLSKDKKKPTYRRLKRLHALEDIVALKKGNVLVRLKTSQSKIEALQKAGKVEKAEKVKNKQAEENRQIVRAFKKEFDFTNVYFFYSQNSKAVKANKLSNIFLNEKLMLDSSIQVDESKASYVIELAYIEADTNQVFAHYIDRSTGSFEQQRQATFHGSPNLGFKAFVIKTQKFEQLLKPFPYYSRFILPSLIKHPEQLLFIGPLVVPLLSATSYDSSVRNLNNKLHKFYRKKDKKKKRWYKRDYDFYKPYLPSEFNSPF